jgi:Flp pilus assembly protein TadG
MSLGEPMQTRSRAFSFRRVPRRFADDSRGTAAMEFVIILPVILAFAFGASEICNLIAIDRKLTITARAISDIVAQDTEISDTEMTNILNAGKVILQPYPGGDLKLRVSAVTIDADKKATVVWSDADPPSEERANGAVTIPPALLIPNTQLIWGEVAYSYKPGFGAFVLKSVWPLTYENNQFFARPRESSSVCRPSCP